MAALDSLGFVNFCVTNRLADSEDLFSSRLRTFRVRELVGSVVAP